MTDDFSGDSITDQIADRTYALAKLVDALKEVPKGSQLLTLGLAHIKVVTASIAPKKDNKVVSEVEGKIVPFIKRR
jgi:hypothetical protein